MHTFFINISEKNILSDKEILDIEQVSRELILLSCQLKKWTDEKAGYSSCAERIGELIDNYREINNDFDLVIYIDLFSIPEYASELQKNDEYKKTACLYAFYSVIADRIKKALIKRLNDQAREPQEIILIFEESPVRKSSFTLDNNDHKEMLVSSIARIIGFPSSELLDHILNESFTDLYKQRDDINGLRDQTQRTEKRINVSITGEMVRLLADKLNEASEGAVFGASYENYMDSLYKMLADIIDNADSSEIRRSFLLSLYASCMAERYKRSGFFFTSIVTDKTAVVKNLTEGLKRDLRICLYLASCIRANTFIEPADANGNPLPDSERADADYYRAKDIVMINRNGWYIVRDFLSEKNRIYKRRLELTLKMRESYAYIGLAPRLEVFDNELFSLDAYGAKSGEEIKRLLDKEAVNEFDYNGLEIVDEMKNKPKIKGKKAGIQANEYIKAAHRLKNLHTTYLERLREHIMDTLSGYAGSSENNKPALPKRIVNIDTNVIDEEGTVCRYKRNDSDCETKKMNIVEKNAANSYNTVRNMYFEYCASNELAVSDITAQCEWLEERMKQIKESLKKMKKVGLVSLIATMCTFIPYIILSWPVITSGMLSFFTGIYSLAVPFALFGGVFGTIAAWQKSKLKKAWDEFWDKHIEALAANKASAVHYDRMLTAYIPALRYIYEYYLDVQFRSECEKLAEAKISHHIQKLQDKINETNKLIADLQLGTQSDNVSLSDKDYPIDYNMTYCTGHNNKSLYSIIDDTAIKLICKGEGVKQ